VDPRALAAALCEAVEASGGELRAGTEVAGVAVEGERVTGVRLRDGATIPAGAVVVAAGAWSADLAGLPEHARVPVRPVKGQLLRLRDPAGSGLLKRAIRTEECYLVPRGDGRYVLGATVEERGFDQRVTAGAMHDLLREAVTVAPGVSELEVEEALAGLRPGTPDNAPVIGPGALEGLHWATGHYRHGILLAAITAEAVAAGLVGERPNELAAPFSPDRFETEVAA
jgi:glycine oxidase